MKNISERRSIFKKLVSEAGFNSINDFARRTLSISGKSRSSSGINNHLSRGAFDIRVLRKYSQDLNCSVYDMLDLFDIDLNQDFSFDSFLLENNFKKIDQWETVLNEKTVEDLFFSFDFNTSFESVFYRRKNEFICISSYTSCISLDLMSIVFSVPFKIYSKELASKLIGL